MHNINNLIFDLFCRAKNMYSSDGTRKKDEDLYKNDPLLPLHTQLCETIIGSLQPTDRPRFLFTWGRKVQAWFRKFALITALFLKATALNSFSLWCLWCLPNNIQAYVVPFQYPEFLWRYARTSVLREHHSVLKKIELDYDIKLDLSRLEFMITGSRSANHIARQPQAATSFNELMHCHQIAFDRGSNERNGQAAS